MVTGTSQAEMLNIVEPCSVQGDTTEDGVAGDLEPFQHSRSDFRDAGT